MIKLSLDSKNGRDLKVLCIGAHSDDIEIGCGGTILRLAEEHASCEFHWAVFNATGVRQTEANCAAHLFAGSRLRSLKLMEFQDGFMPYTGSGVKDVFEKDLKPLAPDVIFTHNGNDAHQDHRLISELTWNTFRNNVILEYEIPKYDGDLGRPNIFVPLARVACEAKVRYLMDAFESQRSKHWFQSDTFFSLMRLRGIECVASSGYAEAFYCRKLVL